jgi:hypothetical protein
VAIQRAYRITGLADPFAEGGSLTILGRARVKGLGEVGARIKLAIESRASRVSAGAG